MYIIFQLCIRLLRFGKGRLWTPRTIHSILESGEQRKSCNPCLKRSKVLTVTTPNLCETSVTDLNLVTVNRREDDIKHWTKFPSFPPLLVSIMCSPLISVTLSYLSSRFPAQSGTWWREIVRLEQLSLYIHGNNFDSVLPLRFEFNVDFYLASFSSIRAEVEGATLCQRWNWLRTDNCWLLLCLLLL